MFRVAPSAGQPLESQPQKDRVPGTPQTSAGRSCLGRRGAEPKQVKRSAICCWEKRLCSPLPYLLTPRFCVSLFTRAAGLFHWCRRWPKRLENVSFLPRLSHTGLKNFIQNVSCFTFFFPRIIYSLTSTLSLNFFRLVTI